MVLRKNYRRRGTSTAKLIIALTALILVVFAGRIWYVKTQTDGVSNVGAVSATSTALSTIKPIDSWNTLRDQEGIFEVKYPKNVLKKIERQEGIPPTWTDKTKALVLAHNIPVEHCGLAGLPKNCTATTTDLAISFYTVNRNFNDIFKELQGVYGSDLPIVTINGHQGVSFEVGAEGEGTIYLVLPVNNAKTLFIGRSYINEGVVGLYRTAKDFIKYADQKALFDQIMSTFIFRTTI